MCEFDLCRWAYGGNVDLVIRSVGKVQHLSLFVRASKSVSDYESITLYAQPWL